MKKGMVGMMEGSGVSQQSSKEFLFPTENSTSGNMDNASVE